MLRPTELVTQKNQGAAASCRSLMPDLFVSDVADYGHRQRRHSLEQWLFACLRPRAISWCMPPGDGEGGPRGGGLWSPAPCAEETWGKPG